MDGRRKRLFSILLLLLLLGVAIALILIRGPLAPTRVRTAPVAQGTLRPAAFGVATIEALRRYDIGPNHGGRLLRLDVDHGDRVARGAVIGMMDPVDLPDRLRAVDKAIEAAEHTVDAADARLRELAQRLQLARDDARRYRALRKQQQVSKEAAEAKATTARALAEQYRAAEANLESSRHQLEKAHAERDAVQALLDDLRLLSPADGVVIARRVEPGSVVMAGTAVVQTMDPKTLWARARIDQKAAIGLRLGQAARIALRDGRELPGRVARIELIADSLTEERWVDVAFTRLPNDLAIGMLANVTIELPAVEGVPWIPAAALHWVDGRAGAWVLKDGKAHFRPLQIGARDPSGKVEVRSGLSNGERIIVHSARHLHEGDRLAGDPDV